MLSVIVTFKSIQIISLGATLGYPQNTFKNDGGQQKQENSEYGGQYVMQQPQYNPYHYGQYGNYYYPNMYWRPSYQYQRPRPQPVQQGGCSGSATCASACLQVPFKRCNRNTQFQMYSLQNQNWYGNWFYPTPKPEEAEEDSTTKPNYNQNQFVISYLQGVPTSFGSNNPLGMIRNPILDQQFILIKNSFWISIAHCLKITQNVAFGIFHQFLSY